MMSKKTVLFMVLSLFSITGCDQPKNKPLGETQAGNLSDSTKYAEYMKALKTKSENTPGGTKKEDPNAKKPGDTTPEKPTDDPNAKKPAATASVNIYKDNASMKSAFEAFDKANLQGSTFSGADMIKDLAEANLDAEKSKALIANLFYVLEMTGDSLSKELAPATRLRHIFDLCATNADFKTAVVDRLKEKTISLPEGLSEEDKNVAIPFLYAEYVWHQFFVQPEIGAGFNIYQTTAADGKKYHIAVLGRIDFKAGSKKKKLTTEDQKNIMALFDFWTAYLGSALAPKDPKFQVVGNGDRTGKSAANKTAGMKRAQMVMNEMKSDSFPDVFTVDSWGDEIPLKDDPKSAENRRVELVLYKTEVTTAPAAQ